MEKSSKLDPRLIGKSTGLDDLIHTYRMAIEKAINETDLMQHSPLSREAQRVMQAGGKRLRPVLVLMSCEAVSGQFLSGIPAALAYEFAHEASLVQDDIFDNSDLRHDKETVHKRQGLIAAVLVSDLMIFEIFNQLAKYESTSLTKKEMAQLMSYISRAANLTIKGEYLEARYATKESFS